MTIHFYNIDCKNASDDPVQIISESNVQDNVRLVSFDAHQTVSGASHSIVVCSSKSVIKAKRSEGVWDNARSDASGNCKFRNFLLANYASIFPEASSHIQKTKVTTRVNNGFGDNNGNFYTTEDYVFPPSATAVGSTSYPGEDGPYSYFASAQTRQFSSLEGSSTDWATRSAVSAGMGVNIICVDESGNFESTGYQSIEWSPLCFVIA